MSVCLTCGKAINFDDQPLTVSENKKVQNALCKHFWFGEHQYLQSVICRSCWLKIEEFHLFYCEVEELHAHQLYPHIQLLEIKQEIGTTAEDFMEAEGDVDSGELYAIKGEKPSYEGDEKVCIEADGIEKIRKSLRPLKVKDPIDDDDVKSEIEDEDSNAGDEDYKHSDSEYTNSDGSNTAEEAEGCSKRTKKHPKATKEEKLAIQKYISEHILLECDTCAVRYITIKELHEHSMEDHNKPATVLCCNRSISNRFRFEEHIRYHLNPNRFKCSQCSRACPNRDALRKHIQQVHTTEDAKLYNCQKCTRKFSTKKGLARHEKIHDESDNEGTGTKRRSRAVDNEKMIAENINLECDSCQKKFESFGSLQKHSSKEHSKLAYVFCCDLRFNKKPRLIDHVLFHLDPTSFQCKICHKNLPHTESLRRHMDSNHAPAELKTLKCSMCPKMFTHLKFLKTHERYHNRRWLCEICNKKFICEANLKYHHKTIHTKELNYVCHVCARTFNIYSSYRSHLETHDVSPKKKPQKPPVQCPVCNAWTGKLSHHMRLHSGTQTCEICGKECKNAISYRYHMKNHEMGDFVCSVCGKGFKREITLKEHMASHTGVSLYSCDFCDRTFNSNANKASHRKKMHPQQWLEDKLRKKAAKLAESAS
ncbi:transcription factor grauzone-like [Armigeres subalbatus]|uniref:transcription factor grauzone-like n=1 Tax=Armigeres subalbatus TaxID=124917 RepID=UPI002ED45350